MAPSCAKSRPDIHLISSIGSKAAIVVARNVTLDAEAGVMPLAVEAMGSPDPRRIVERVAT